MKHWISCVARAYEREPGLFLLAASVVLAVVFWHLPVPAFLFADPASGSAILCNCSLPNNNCESWEKDGEAVKGPNSGWEFIKSKLASGTCGRRDKNFPEAYFYYEYYTPTCNNTKSCTHAGAAPPEYPYNVETCLAKFKRDVVVNSSGSGGPKEIAFTPRTKIEFHSFLASNVCPNIPQDRKMTFLSGVFAKMRVCDTDVKDPNFTRTPERPADDPLMGWDFKQHEFVWTESDSWHIARCEGTTSEITQFNLHLSSTCELCPNTKDDPHETIDFVCHVQNTGVLLGGASEPQERPAHVKFFILQGIDTTTCAPPPPP